MTDSEKLERAYDYMESIAMILSSPVADDRTTIGAIEKEIEGFYGKKIFADTDTEFIKRHYCSVCGDKFTIYEPNYMYCEKCDILHIKGENK